ncbi:MAG TPA: hypothetical protein VFO34_01555 [Candidatus Acidoferrales bacterium]|nr:hypothetical protein [Candidatus Acidoferrales bacterium]
MMMTEPERCICSFNCVHHRGSACSNDAKVMTWKQLNEFGDREETKPVSLGYCAECIAAVSAMGVPGLGVPPIRS